MEKRNENLFFLLFLVASDQPNKPTVTSGFVTKLFFIKCSRKRNFALSSDYWPCFCLYISSIGKVARLLKDILASLACQHFYTTMTSSFSCTEHSMG